MKNLTKLTILSAVILGGFNSLSAQDELSITTTWSWESSYVFRSVQYAEDYFAPSVDFSYGNFYAGLWAALPVDDEFGNEIDTYVGYTFTITDMISGDIGATYYAYPDAQDEPFDADVNTLETYIGFSLETAFNPSLYLFYDLDLESFTGEVSVGDSYDVGENTAMDVSLYGGFVEPDVGQEYQYFGASVGGTYSFTDSASASLAVNWATSSEELMLDGRDELWFSVSVTTGF